MSFERTSHHTNDIYRQHDDWDEVHNQLLAIQKKSLEVSDPNDADEKEADEVARKVANGGSAEINGTGSTINRKGEGTVETTQEFESQLHSSKGGGQSLDDSTRNEMESKMGADFSGVKIHTGSNAHTMNEGVNAKAFAHGSDIYFKQGEYNPGAKQGKELLAHELTHTVQQKNGDSARLIQRSAVATKSGKKINVEAMIYYYGGEAKDGFGDRATASINQHWNAPDKVPNGPDEKISIGDQKYDVEFKIKGKEITEEEAKKRSLSSGSDLRNNFVRVEKKSATGPSHMAYNHGFFASEDADAAEYAHEFGHSIGLQHSDIPKNIPKVDVFNQETGVEQSRYDARGLDPGIMMLVGGVGFGNIVDPEFQYDPALKVTDTAPGKVSIPSAKATFDTGKRKVSKANISALGLAEKLKDKAKADLVYEAEETIQWGYNEEDVAKTKSFPGAFYEANDTFNRDVYEQDLRNQFATQEAQFIRRWVIDIKMGPNFSNTISKIAPYGETIDESKYPEMKGKYMENTVRDVFYSSYNEKISVEHIKPKEELKGLEVPKVGTLLAPGLSKPRVIPKE